MDGLAEHAKHILAMREGEIIMSGTPKEVFSRHEDILEAGLGLPEAAKTAYLLNKKGMGVPEELIRRQELTEYLINRFGGGRQ